MKADIKLQIKPSRKEERKRDTQRYQRQSVQIHICKQKTKYRYEQANMYTKIPTSECSDTQLNQKAV